MMITDLIDLAEVSLTRTTLLRLANSCERLASRGGAVAPLAHDLDAADYRTIAEVLRSVADRSA